MPGVLGNSFGGRLGVFKCFVVGGGAFESEPKT
jgi:hypothetical protein